MAVQEDMVRRQRVLADFGDFVLDHDDLDEILNEGCRLVADALGAELAKVIEIERATNTGYVRAGVGWRPGIVGHERVSLSERSSEAYAIEKAEPIITNDISREDRFDFPSFLRDHDVVALVNVPILLPGRRPWGVLQVDARRRRHFDQQDVEFLKTYSMVLGPVIDRMRVAQERTRAEDALQNGETRYRTLFEAMDEAYAVVEVLKDDAGKWIDFRFIEVNPAFVEHTSMPWPVGKTATELLGTPNPRWTELYGQALDTGQAIRIEEVEPTLDRTFDLNIFSVDRERNRVAVLFTNITQRKKAEAALAASEAKFRTLFDAIDEGLAVVEMIYDDQGEIVDMIYRQTNSAYERHGGVHDVVGRSIFDVIPGVEEHWLTPYKEVARTGVGQRVQNYQRDVDRWFDVYFSRVDDAGRFVAIVFNDVTDRKRGEIELREAQERQTFLLKLTDAIRPLAGPAEIQGETTSLLRQHLNAAWCYYVDWDLDRNLGRVLRDSATEGLPSLAGAHDVSDAREFLQLLALGAVLTVRDYASYEQLPTRIRQNFTALGVRSMMAAPLVKEGALIATLLVGDTKIRDWSASEASLLVETAERTWAAVERARAQAALRESEARFRQFADASSDVLWVRDAETLIMEYLSPAFERVYGRRKERLLGTAEAEWADLIHPEDRQAALDQIGRVRAGEAVTYEFRITRPDGQVRWIEDTDFPLADAAGGVQRIGGFARDVTEAKKAAEHQRLLLAELQHRVRNILAMMRSLVRRSGESARTAEELHQHLDGRIDALARTQVLLTRRAGGGIDLSSLIFEELLAQAADDGRVSVTGPPVMLAPKAAEVLTLALHELATNATKYGAFSQPDGSLAVDWDIEEEERQLWLRLAWIERGVRIASLGPRRAGFGTELVTKRVPYELRGRGALELTPRGLHCRIEFPLVIGDSILDTREPGAGGADGRH